MVGEEASVETTVQAYPDKVTDLPLVSMLIASYRSGTLLYEAVNSVLLQDYPRLELLVCDDGSEEFDEPALFDLWKDASVPTTLIRQHVNVGTVKNLNAGLRQSTGEYLLFFAADDLLASPTVVRELVHLAQRSASPWVMGRTQVCDTALRPTGKLLPTAAHTLWLKDSHTFYGALCLDCFLPACGNLYARALLEQVDFLDERFRLVEDWPLMLKLARAGCLPAVSDVVTVYRRSGGVSNHKPSENQRYQRDLIDVMQWEILPNLGQLNASSQQKIRRQCADKEDIYGLRFETARRSAKLYWAVRHLPLLWRKALRYRKGGST